MNMEQTNAYYLDLLQTKIQNKEVIVINGNQKIFNHKLE